MCVEVGRCHCTSHIQLIAVGKAILQLSDDDTVQRAMGLCPCHVFKLSSLHRYRTRWQGCIHLRLGMVRTGRL